MDFRFKEFCACTQDRGFITIKAADTMYPFSPRIRAFDKDIRF